MPSPKVHQRVAADRGGLLDGVRSGEIRRTGSITGPVVELGLAAMAVCCFMVVVRASVERGGLTVDFHGQSKARDVWVVQSSSF
jgi:hypothetical protein